MNFTWQQQDFDTQIFGFPVAKIIDITASGTAEDIYQRVTLLVEELRHKDIEYATYRLPANAFSVIHQLEKAGFVTVDEIVAMDIDKSAIVPQSNEKIRKAKLEDLVQLKNIVKKSFTANRFYNDPVIPKDKADVVYEKWIENSLNGDQADEVLVYEEKGEVLGFVTLQKKGHIPLIAILEKARGKGIAKQLIRSSFQQFNDWGCETIEIEASLNNIPALRAYEGCGFRISDSFVTLRWTEIIL